MKRYIYKAEFKAYDRATTEYWEYDEAQNFGIIENRILTICQTAVFKRIVQRDTHTGNTVTEFYKNNKPTAP